MPLPKIVWEKGKELSLQDKQKIEALKERLNQQIQKDQKIARKAALILEQWLKKTKP